jgi:hypothetical protein
MPRYVAEAPEAEIPEKRNLSQLIQQALCRHQIAGFESFGEPTMAEPAWDRAWKALSCVTGSDAIALS